MPRDIEQATEEDLQILADQLGRVPRGVAGIAARSRNGVPLVVATVPRLSHGEPFPTTFYLTHPDLVRALSSIEAAGDMSDYQEMLKEPSLAEGYRRAHEAYIEARRRIGAEAGVGEVPEIDGVSAGGMPQRVKCLHALVGHALAAGPGVNPIGDLVLRRLYSEGTWRQEGWEAEADTCELQG